MNQKKERGKMDYQAPAVVRIRRAEGGGAGTVAGGAEGKVRRGVRAGVVRFVQGAPLRRQAGYFRRAYADLRGHAAADSDAESGGLLLDKFVQRLAGQGHAGRLCPDCAGRKNHRYEPRARRPGYADL